MKVGTDAILLASWVFLSQNAKKVLDVGCGTGVISAIVSQRLPKTDFQLIDIDGDSVEEARMNFVNLSWKPSFQTIRHDFFTYDFQTQFDLIISNPPYFIGSFSSNIDGRNLARSADFFDFHAFLNKSKQLLANQGKIVLILPVHEAEMVIEMAFEIGLFLNELCEVYPKASKPIKRMMMVFQKEELVLQSTKIIIMNEDDSYTAEFKSLTQDFYLNF